MKTILLFIIYSLLLVSCASRPESVLDLDVTQELSVPDVFDTPETQESQIVDGLLELFKDETLSKFVLQSLDDNLGVRLAYQQFEAAGFRSGSQAGKLLPQVEGNVVGNRSRGQDDSTMTTFTPSLDVSWEIDLWGKIRDQQDSLTAITEASKERYLAMRDSVSAQTMKSWFDVITAEKQIVLEESRLENFQKSVRDSELKYLSGLGQLDDIEAVKRDIAQIRAAIAVNEGNFRSAVRSLKMLTGRYPTNHITAERRLPLLLPPPAAGLPAELLTERPDLRAAWLDVVAADKSVSATHKEIFPSITLTGSVGTASSQISDLVSGVTIWSLAGKVTGPIFDGGTLENNLNLAGNEAKQAWILYLQAALRAFGEVERGLDQDAILALKEREQDTAVRHAENTARIFEERYRNGLVSVLEYLSAQNRVYTIKAQLLNTQNDRLKNRVSLALALGKGV